MTNDRSLEASFVVRKLDSACAQYVRHATANIEGETSSVAGRERRTLSKVTAPQWSKFSREQKFCVLNLPGPTPTPKPNENETHAKISVSTVYSYAGT